MKKRQPLLPGTMTSADLYQHAVTQGLEMDSHESDLYLKVCHKSQALIQAYKFRENVTTFISQIDKQAWYGIPFAYQPFWDKVAKRAAR